MMKLMELDIVDVSVGGFRPGMVMPVSTCVQLNNGRRVKINKPQTILKKNNRRELNHA